MVGLIVKIWQFATFASNSHNFVFPDPDGPNKSIPRGTFNGRIRFIALWSLKLGDLENEFSAISKIVTASLICLEYPPNEAEISLILASIISSLVRSEGI